jgi:hypothetical protein
MFTIPSFLEFLSSSIRGNIVALCLVVLLVSFVLILISGAIQRAHVSSVIIGLAPNMAADKRHGVVWVKDAQGGLSSVSFFADRPEILKDPTIDLIAALFQQVRGMGFTPERIELMVTPRTVMYKVDERRPAVAFTRPVAW